MNEHDNAHFERVAHILTTSRRAVLDRPDRGGR